MVDTNETYYIRLRGKIRGPFQKTQLKQLHARGQFGKLYQISHDKEHWESAEPLIAQLTGRAAVVETQLRQAAASPGALAPEEWFYVLEQQRLGPISETILHQQIAAGNIQDTTLLWRKGMQDWVEASELFPAAFVKSKSRLSHSLIWGSVAGLLVIGSVITGVLWWQSGHELPTASTIVSEITRPAEEIRSMDMTDQAVQKRIAESVGMVVCYVEVVCKTGERHELGLGQGSCFVVTPDGYAITNLHVIEDQQMWQDATPEGRINKLAPLQVNRIAAYYHLHSRELTEEARQKILGILKNVSTENVKEILPQVKVYFGSEGYPAEISYLSKRFDMAILKIDRPSRHKSYLALAGENDAPQTSPVLSLGFPGVNQNAITDPEKAVEVLNNAFENDFELLFGKRNHRQAFKDSAFRYVSTPGEISVVQQETGGIYNVHHTAAINQGNSGGPLVFRSGKQAGIVFGINTIIMGAHNNVNIAFQIAQMKPELEEVIGAGKLAWR